MHNSHYYAPPINLFFAYLFAVLVQFAAIKYRDFIMVYFPAKVVKDFSSEPCRITKITFVYAVPRAWSPLRRVKNALLVDLINASTWEWNWKVKIFKLSRKEFKLWSLLSKIFLTSSTRHTFLIDFIILLKNW